MDESQNKIAREIAISERLIELDEILRLAANEYQRTIGPVIMEKAALTQEQFRMNR